MPPKFEGLYLALRYYNTHRIKEAEEECTRLLAKNPLDQVGFRHVLSFPERGEASINEYLPATCSLNVQCNTFVE